MEISAQPDHLLWVTVRKTKKPLMKNKPTRTIRANTEFKMTYDKGRTRFEFQNGFVTEKQTLVGSSVRPNTEFKQGLDQPLSPIIFETIFISTSP